MKMPLLGVSGPVEEQKNQTLEVFLPSLTTRQIKTGQE